MTKTHPPLRRYFIGTFVVLSIAYPPDLYAVSSKKLFVEDVTHAAQEERLNRTASQGQNPAGPGSSMMSEEQWVMLVYQKGKESYDRGDYPAAKSEWDKLGNVLERYPAFKTVIDYLRGKSSNLTPEAAAKVEKRLEERRKQIDTLFKKGKEFYDQGKMTEALAEWDKLAAYLPEDAPQRRLMLDLKKYYNDANTVPSSQVLTKETSEELLKFFASSAELFKTQAVQAKKALSEVENAQKSIEDSFAAGRQRYYEGKYGEAIKELQKMSPYFPEGSKERRAIDDLVTIYNQAGDEKAAAERAIAEKNVRAKLPTDFSKFSSEVNERFEADLKEAETKRLASEKSFQDRQSWMSDDFAKGMEYYRKGQVDLAIKQWEQLAPHFENERQIRELIQGAKKNQAELERIRSQQAGELAERQALVDGRIDKSRLLFEAGNFEEGKKVLLSLKEFIQDEKKLDDFISQVEKVYRDLGELKRVEQDAKFKASEKLETPKSLDALLLSLQTSLNSQNSKTRQAQTAADALEKQRASVEAKITTGRAFYEGGKLEEAKKEWLAIKPYVQDPQKVDEIVLAIEKTSREIQQLLESEKKLSAASGVKLTLPASMDTILAQAQKELQARKAEAQKLQASAEGKQKQKEAVQSKVDAGKILFDAGKIEEAKKEWLSAKPLVYDGQKIDEIIAALEKTALESRNLEKAEKEHRAVAEAKLKTPDSLAAYLVDAQQHLKSQMEKTRSAQSAADAVEKQKAYVQSKVESGRSLYEAGKLAEAKKEWTSIKDVVTDGPKVDEFVSGMEKVFNETREMEKAEQAAKKYSEVKIKSPESFAVILQTVKDRLKSQTEEARSQKTLADNTVKEREGLLEKTIAAGKHHLEAGRIPDALKEWATLLSIIENPELLEKNLTNLKSDYDESMKAAAEAKIAEGKKEGKLRTPDEFVKLLQDIGKQMRAESDAAMDRKKRAEQSLVDRQAFVDDHFSKGRALYLEGRYAEALTEWSTALPSLEDEAKLKPMINELIAGEKALSDAQKSAAKAETSRNDKIKTPEGLSKLLEEALGQLQAKTAAAKNKQFSAEEARVSREKLVQNTFDKGRALYDQGKYSDAVKEWSVILDELDSGDSLRVLIKELEAKYEDSIAASKAAEDADLKKNVKLAAPSGLKALLTELSQKINSQTQTYDARRESAEKVLIGRQKEADAVFAKGKLLAEEGHVADALNQWAALLPSLEEEASLRQTIAQIQADQAKLAEIAKAAEQSEKMQNSKITAPAGLSQTVTEMSAKMKGDLEMAKDRKAAAEKRLADANTLVQNTFEKGKMYYQDGRFREAIDEWKSLAPMLDDHAVVQTLLDSASKDYEQLAFALKSAADAESVKDKKQKTPDSLVSLLQGVSDQIRIQTLEAKNRKAEADQVQISKQSEADKAVMRGNALYREGNLEGAQKEWLSIASLVEDPGTVKNAVDALTKLHQDRQQLKLAEKEIIDMPLKRFTAPSDISAELADAAKKFASEKSEMDAKRLAAEQTLAKRQSELQQTYDQGKQFYWEGKIAEAVQKWVSIAPLLEDSEIRKGIEALAKNYDNLLMAQKQMQEAELKKDNKLRSPEDLERILGDAKQVIHSQTQYAETQKKIADQTFVDRQALINTTFQKGKKLYEENRIPEALEEWAAITPYLQKGSELKEFIDAVAKNYEKSVAAKRAAEEAETRKSVKFSAPEDMTKYLNAASSKLEAQVQDAKMETEASNRLRRDRQNLVNSKFEKGKVLYNQGRVEEAIDEWKAILPYIEDDSQVRRLILKAEENRQLLQADQKSSKAIVQQSEPVALPSGFKSALSQANQTIEKKVADQSRKRLEDDVRNVIQGKKEKLKEVDVKKPASKTAGKLPLDEIDQMMLEYNVTTPAELEKRHQELKAVK